MVTIKNDFEQFITAFKFTKLDPFEKLIRTIENPKALELLKQSLEQYQLALELNSKESKLESKQAFTKCEELIYSAIANNYYIINSKPGASLYIVVDGQVEDRTEAGLFLPISSDGTKPYNEGVIVAIGDCYIKNTKDGEVLIKPMNKVGDKVKYRKGIEIPFECTINNVVKKCKAIDFTTIITTEGQYYSTIGTFEPATAF